MTMEKNVLQKKTVNKQYNDDDNGEKRIAKWHESRKKKKHHQTSNIRLTLVGNTIVDNSDHEVETSPVDAAPTTSSLST